VSEAKWPSRRIRKRRWSLGDGRLTRGRARGLRFAVRSPETTGLAGGEWCPYGTGGQGPEFPGDQREDDGKSLVFDSPPLTERVEILGAAVATIALESDRPTAYVIARLCDVAPDGASTRIAFGVLNLSHRESHEHPAPVVPGERMVVRVQLNDAAYTVRPGHRLRLAISTNYWPMVWPAPEPVTLTVHTDGSALELPERPPLAEDAALPSLGEPEAGPPSRRTVLEPGRWENTIERDLKTGLITVAATRYDGIVRLESNGLEMGRGIEERTSIREGDPLSAVTVMTHQMRLGRGDWRIRMEASSHLSATREAFVLVSDLTAYEGDTKIFERRFERTIPRDGV
jgi:hypothetical protein